MDYSSKLIEDAVNAFATLPGIGKKTALRLTLHLLNKDPGTTTTFVEAIDQFRQKIQRCKQCFNIADDEVCLICKNHARNRSVICVVEGIRDVMAIEDTAHYNGLYHVLDGVISPIDGVGPEQLNIESLVERIKKEDIEEVIMAISPTIEGETTIYYLTKQLQGQDVRVTQIARGVAFGGELELADEITLGRSIVTRIPYETNR